MVWKDKFIIKIDLLYILNPGYRIETLSSDFIWPFIGGETLCFKGLCFQVLLLFAENWNLIKQEMQGLQ